MAKKVQKTTSWRRNFRRWSTQMFLAIGALNILQWGPDLIGAFTGALPHWKPLMSADIYAAVNGVLAFLGMLLRNIKQHDEEDHSP